MINNDEVEFTDKEIIVFYKLVYYVEKEIKSKNSKGFNIQNKDFKKFYTTHKITIVEADTKTIEQKTSEGNNYVYFTNTRRNQIASILVHFRNAICHLQIEDEKGCFLLKDTHNNSTTMEASIQKELFAELIEAMKATRK